MTKKEITLWRLLGWVMVLVPAIFLSLTYLMHVDWKVVWQMTREVLPMFIGELSIVIGIVILQVVKEG